MEQFILEINIFSNIYLIAISIMVQFIIYPSFKNYSESTFKSFHSAYTKKMLFIVGPIMILELLSTLYLVIKNSFFFPTLIVTLIWLTTFFLIVPVHQSLNSSFNIRNHKKLLRLNFVRSTFWVLKLFLILA